MKVKCIKKVSDSFIRIGETYMIDTDSIGYKIKCRDHTFVMPHNVFMECFEKMD